jgi:hypothetical protein
VAERVLRQEGDGRTFGSHGQCGSMSERRLTLPCQIAIDEIRRTARNVRRFWNLIYCVSAATAVAVLFSIVNVVRGVDPSFIVAGLAVIVGGGGVAFLVKMKNSALEEHELAKMAVKQDCLGQRSGRRDGGSDEEQQVIDPAAVVDALLADT